MGLLAKVRDFILFWALILLIAFVVIGVILAITWPFWAALASLKWLFN